jgi:beta-lactamase class D
LLKYLTILILLAACASDRPPEDEAHLLKGLRACFLLFDLNQNKLLREVGDSCYESYPATSTFKVPLAVMAFDSGILTSEEQILEWDQKQHHFENWNKNQNARTWMLYSVVWFSQRITLQLGEDRLQRYLNDFDYGNKNLRAGITDAWLVSPSSSGPALRISPREQLAFLQKLWTSKLPVSQRSQKLTREVMYLETTPAGWKISGKTGSGTYRDDENRQLGWYVGAIERGQKSYLFVTQFSDSFLYDGVSFGSFRAKELTLRFFQQNGLW